MIRVRGVKVKEFVLNGCFDRLYSTKSPVNGFPKSLDIKTFGRLFNDKCHKSLRRLAILQRPRLENFSRCESPSIDPPSRSRPRARLLRVLTHRTTLILNGRGDITSDTALRRAYFFGTSAEFWIILGSEHHPAGSRKNHQGPSHPQAHARLPRIEPATEQAKPSGLDGLRFEVAQ